MKRIRAAVPCARLALLLGALLAVSPAGAREAADGAARPNHLLGQTSPYLQEHLYNPVDWYPWGEEAIARARDEGKPIFLSIGYSACHWCHVMEREAFSDLEVARVLKESFVSIKVDREERPDLDDLYMTAVMAMTGGGGWPLTVFLTPDLEPFMGGTYFPKERFKEIALGLAAAWKERKEEITATARRLRQAIDEAQRTPAPAALSVDGGGLLPRAVAALKARFDRTNGGFGQAPKFPPHGALWVLLRAHGENGDSEALDMAVRTLDAMARGGIYDQVGGGFHRYATDAAWRLPHFEKMLYDNALLAPLYVEAWKRTGREDFRRVAEETLDWADDEMADPAGGFYGALDADSEGEEGRFYLWTADEVRRAVGPRDSGIVEAYYGVSEAGALPGGGNVLRRPLPLDQFAKARAVPVPGLASRLQTARRKLLEARRSRVRPRLDDKVLTAWNGLMISALARTYEATGEERYREAALRSARFATRALLDATGRPRVSWRRGVPGAPGFLDDTAFLAQGFLDLHEAVGDRGWLDAAARLVADGERFLDREGGGYFFAPADRADLIVRMKSLSDGALPSGNAVIAACQARLARLRQESAALEPAARLLDLASPGIAANPSSYPYMILAAGLVGEASGAARAAAAAAEPARPSSGTPPPAGATGRPAAETILHGTIVGRPSPQKVVDARLTVPNRPVRPGEAVTLSLLIDISPGWHVNSHRPTLKYLIPTKIEFPGTADVSVEDVAYPDGATVELKFAKEKLSVYMGRTAIRPTLRPSATAPRGALTIPARLTYQACSDTACLAPETVEFAIPLVVEGEPVAAGRTPAVRDASRPAADGEGARPAAAPNPLAAMLVERGLLFVLGVVFLGGLALNLTPCVYPMLPVTIGYFANQAEGGGWGRRVTLPSLYVLGMALTYSTLGMVAGMTGRVFGSTLQSPWVLGALVLLFVAMALWMFGLFELRLPGALTRFAGGRSGTVGALLMGLTVGLVAAPCIGPFVVTLLAFVGASGKPVLGFWLFFVLALGMGLPSLVLGIFSGALASLPRSGVWLLYAKKVMGIALLGVAIYFLQPLLSDRVLGALVLGFTAAAGAYLVFLARSRAGAFGFAPIRLAIALLVVALGAWMALPLVGARAEVPWQPYSPEALEEAKAAGRPVVIDFFAEWCLPCKELDRFTFSDPRVREETERFTLLKADLTSFESEPVGRLRDQYGVLGMPTVVLIDGQGAERADLRLHGVEGPEPFLARLRRVR